MIKKVTATQINYFQVNIWMKEADAWSYNDSHTVTLLADHHFIVTHYAAGLGDAV